MNEALRSEIDSLRNLRPRLFAVATDHLAKTKARWDAFDELYEAVCQNIISKGQHPEDVLLAPTQRAGTVLGPGLPPLTVLQEERAKRVAVALMLIMVRYDYNQEALLEAMMEAEILVPTAPDPDTGRPGISLKDQALLNVLTNQMRHDMKDDWDAFFLGDTVPAAKRKLAFRRMYAVIAHIWMQESLFPRSMTPENRQKFLIFTFMCHVPGDQWGEDDLKQLHADLLPIEEPDWSDHDLFPPKP